MASAMSQAMAMSLSSDTHSHRVERCIPARAAAADLVWPCVRAARTTARLAFVRTDFGWPLPALGR